MDTFFSADFFIRNRQALRNRIGSNIPIVITGNGLMQRSGDEPTTFHQDSSFWYLTGINNPDLTLVILANETYLIVPVLSFEREAFDGAHDLTAYAARSGIQTILDARVGWQRLKSSLQDQRTVAVLASPPAFMKRHGLHTLPYRRRLIAKLKRYNPRLSFQDVRPEMAALRCIKQPQELRAIQSAIDITTETLQEIVTKDTLATATREYQIEAALSYGFRNRGAESHAFAPVVGAGRHSTTLHHTANDGVIALHDVIVLDVGASVEHYAADITRTVSQQPIRGRAAEIFRAVAAVQDFALSQIKPGILPLDYERRVRTYMGEQLRALGVITEVTDDAIHKYFPHATSHFLGLDTHDVGDYREPWQENMVITCEPGIYIPEEGIGVRIEDNVLITSTGNTVLSAACPRELVAVQ